MGDIIEMSTRTVSDDDYEMNDLKFVWGVKSYDDLSDQDADLYTMNDIDIVYDAHEKMYYLGIETIYVFDNFEASCQYLRGCLDAFTKFMDDNSLQKNQKYSLHMINPHITMKSETIEMLYTQFKIFVNGYCSQED